jgi:hypothetical protein
MAAPFSKKRKELHDNAIDPLFKDKIPPEFGKGNRAFWDDLNAQVWGHIETMITILGGDMDAPKDPHMTNIRHTHLLQLMGEAKDECAKLGLDWAVEKVKSE